MKLIKEAMLTSKLGANASKAAEVKRALGVTQLDESIVNAVNKLNESGPTGEYALSPEQIVDQVCQLAQNAGVNCSYMSGKQFTQFAREFRIELEDHYDEVYSNGEWKQLVSGAWQHYVMNKDQGVQDVVGQENEEQQASHHSEGFRAGYKRGGANPHQPGTPAHKEWQDGYEMGQEQREYDSREENEEQVGGMSEAAILAKLARVVKSVKTPEQYEAAKNYANLVFNKLNDTIRNKQGFAGLGNSVSLMNDIKAELHGLRKRLWPVNSGDTVGQENEEQGWPSDESSEDDFRSAEAEMMNDPSFRDEYNAPWGDEDDVGLGDDELEAPWPGDEDTRGRFQEENEEHGMSLRDFLGRSDIAGERRSMPQAARDPASTAREQKVRDAMKTSSNVNLSQEQQGWYDAQQGGTPKYPTDSEYMKGWDRYQAVNKPWAKGGVENEEQDGDKKGSMLKSLLTQRKEVSQKASEISKKYEAEGAKAFHEIRMKHEKSPYCPTKQCDEHNSWTKGWVKAAMQHYNPEPEDTKKPAKKKPAKKK